MAERRELVHIWNLPSGRCRASYIGPDMRRYNGPVTLEAKACGAIVQARPERA